MKKKTRKKTTVAEKKLYDGKTPLHDPKQELFCVLYTSNTTPAYFGHGQACYAFAYGFQERINEIEALLVGPTKDRKGVSLKALQAEKKRKWHVCAVNATRLLTRADISTRCNYLMDSLFTDEIMDRELVWTLQQRRDLASKMTAWGHAAKLKQRIREKVETTVIFEPIQSVEFILPVKPKK